MLKAAGALMLLIGFLWTNLGAEEIRIFGNENRFPKIYLKDGQPKGILVDILRSMERDLNVTFRIELYPWLRTYALARAGKGGIVGISQNSERLRIFDYSDVLIYDEISIVVYKPRSFRFESYGDLAGKRLGYCRGCSFGYRFEEAKRYFEPVEVSGNEHEAFQMLKSGRLDGYILSQKDRALRRICHEYPDLPCGEFVALPRPLTLDPNYLAFAKDLNRSAFLQRFNRVLKRRIEDGTIERIVRRYGGADAHP